MIAKLPRIVLSLSLILAFATGSAMAAEPPPALQPAPPPPSPQPAPPPPPLPSLTPDAEAALEPQVTIIERDGNREEEYRINGRLYMIKVTPTHGGTPYYLLDSKGDGSWQRRDSLDIGNHIPMWVIFSF